MRLPVAEDLGPNYFALFARVSESGQSASGAGQISAALVAFGYSERAKLRDERIERDGPLAAVARVSRHPSTESAARYAETASVADGLDLSATDGAASELGLTATLTGSPPSTHELAPDLTAIRTLQTGWFGALDGSRAHTLVEKWTALDARTVLTVVLVWRSQVTDGWGQSLVQRLVQTRPGQAATHGS